MDREMSRIVVLHVPGQALQAIIDRQPTEPVSQLDEINKWAIRKDIWHKFELLSGQDAYYNNVLREEQDNNVHPQKLFLGQNPRHQTWALIRIFEGTRKQTEVIFRNVDSDGNSVVVKDLDHLSLMYPWRVFKKSGKWAGTRHLKQLVQYVFLASGQVEKIFQDGQTHHLSLLSAALSRLHETHQIKGTENVPKVHAPEPISRNAIDDDVRTDAGRSLYHGQARRAIIASQQVDAAAAAQAAEQTRRQIPTGNNVAAMPNKQQTRRPGARPIIPHKPRTHFPQPLASRPPLPNHHGANPDHDQPAPSHSPSTHLEAAMSRANDAVSHLSLQPSATSSRAVTTPFAAAIQRAKRKASTPGQGFEAFKILKGGVDTQAARKERIREEMAMRAAQRGQRAVLRLRLDYLNYATAQSGLRYVPLVKLWV